jgi:glycosyltransferase involved in cell wall biosynthesis
MNSLPCSWSVIYINDGSRDATLCGMIRLQISNPNVSVLNLSRNFGKEAAMTAGLDHSTGDAVVVIDADLQDPPELIPKLVAAWREGVDIVYAQRSSRVGDTWAKQATASLFYRLMTRIGRVNLPIDTGDFRLMSRRAVNDLLKLREHHRFMKGLFAWVGYSQVAVQYDRCPRYAGQSTWNYWHLWNFALEGITSFTVMPLKLATYVGLLVAMCAGIYGLIIIFITLILGRSVPGYPSLIVAILLMGGTQLMTLGILGEYIGRIFNEVKGRPLYLVERFVPARTPCPANQDRALGS